MNTRRINTDIHERWHTTPPLEQEEVDQAVRELHAVYAHRPDLLLRWMDVIRLVHEGKTYAEIATTLNVSRSRVYQLYWRTLWRVRQRCMSRKGEYVEEEQAP